MALLAMACYERERERELRREGGKSLLAMACYETSLLFDPVFTCVNSA